ncbi:flavin reductase family protein [Paenirhodobacter populi]|uniref:Flavin reductase family protein n=1 Tax=Paenirhodobacter populi TaxID=2306993 RepID=A0A443ISC6_9RHOB|nr:flavin reductase family protein [Sinirhodobacter populi]RWR09584.1 flavin reductase family protein [Sinirhodobacter populi]
MFWLTRDGSGLVPDPLTAIVSPRPIAWVTSHDGKGGRNLAPYSFFNAVAYAPPQLVLASIGGKPDRAFGKDSLANILETGVFCVNIAGYEDREALNASSAAFPRETDEAAHLGLPTAPCRAIDGVRLADAPAALECVLTQHIVLEGADNHLVVARIEAFHLRDDCITEEGRFDVTRYRPLTRLGYSDFASIDSVFRMKRPKV